MEDPLYVVHFIDGHVLKKVKLGGAVSHDSCSQERMIWSVSLWFCYLTVIMPIKISSLYIPNRW